MKKFTFFEHTADVLFESYGKTLEECVENAALAMFNIMGKPAKLKKTVNVTVKQTSRNIDEMLVFMLDQLVGYSDASQVFWKEFKVKKISQNKKTKAWTVEGTAFGSPYHPKAAGTHVKAVTMHRTRVGKDEKGTWVARIVLDI